MTLRPKPFQPIKMLQIIGGVFFAYLFFGFMLLPCLNTLTSIFTVIFAIILFNITFIFNLS